MDPNYALSIATICIFAIIFGVGLIGTVIACRASETRGFKQVRGWIWYPIVLVSGLRIASGAIGVVYYSNPAQNASLYIWYAILGAVALAPLIQGAASLLRMFFAPELQKALRVLDILATVSMILGIVGGTQNSIVFFKVVAIVMLIAVLIMMGFIFYGYTTGQADRLLHGLTATIPFFLARIAYVFVFVFTDSTWIEHLVLGIIMEIFIMGIFIYLGFTHGNPHKTTQQEEVWRFAQKVTPSNT